MRAVDELWDVPLPARVSLLVGGYWVNGLLVEVDEEADALRLEEAKTAHLLTVDADRVDAWKTHENGGMPAHLRRDPTRLRT